MGYKRIDDDKAWSIVSDIYKGNKSFKKIGFDYGISETSVLNIKKELPLFCYNNKDD